MSFEFSDFPRWVSVLGVVFVIGLVVFSLWLGVGFLVGNATEIDEDNTPFRGDSESEVVPDSTEDFVVSSEVAESDWYYEAEVRYDADENRGVIERLNENRRTVIYIEKNSNSDGFTYYMRYDNYREGLNRSSYTLDELNSTALAHSTFSEGDNVCIRNGGATQFTVQSTESFGEFVESSAVPPFISGSPMVKSSDTTYELRDGFVVFRNSIIEQTVYVSSGGELQFDEGGELVDSTVEYSRRSFVGSQVGPFTFVTDIGPSRSSGFDYSRSYEDVSVEKPDWVERSGCY